MKNKYFTIKKIVFLFSKFVTDIRVQTKKLDFFELEKLVRTRISWLIVVIIKRKNMFKLVSKYEPSGDQPQAIEKLVEGIQNGKKEQVLLGATGTRKTFTIVNVIAKTNKPTLVLAHSKTLVGQLYAELKKIFS